MKEYSDDEIITCLRTRKNYAVRFLYNRYLPLVRHIVLKMGGTSDDAIDIFQEGLLILISKIDNKNFILSCKLKTYLYCVCENLWKSELVKKKAGNNYFRHKLADDSITDFTEQYDYKLCEVIFYGAFETLDPLHQKILKLFWRDFSLKEIANTLGYTYGYVKKEKCEGQSELIKRVKMHPDYNQITDSDSRTRSAW